MHAVEGDLVEVKALNKMGKVVKTSLMKDGRRFWEVLIGKNTYNLLEDEIIQFHSRSMARRISIQKGTR